MCSTATPMFSPTVLLAMRSRLHMLNKHLSIVFPLKRLHVFHRSWSSATTLSHTLCGSDYRSKDYQFCSPQNFLVIGKAGNLPLFKPCWRLFEPSWSHSCFRKGPSTFTVLVAQFDAFGFFNIQPQSLLLQLHLLKTSSNFAQLSPQGI